MAVVTIKTGPDKRHYLEFPNCPSCGEFHSVPVDGLHAWKFNGNVDKPTITPSVKHHRDSKPPYVCHYNLTDGILHVCADSTGTQGDLPLPVLS